VYLRINKYYKKFKKGTWEDKIKLFRIENKIRFCVPIGAWEDKIRLFKLEGKIRLYVPTQEIYEFD